MESIRERMEMYCQKLLEAGMLEPTKWENSDDNLRFYKPVTELTAFVVNLRGTEFYVEITFGYASTAFTRMAGDENALIYWGVDDEYITLREKLLICDEAEEEAAAMQIQKFHDQYLQTEKEELLNVAKAKRKAFLQQIADKLKPLGFRKKANTWTRPLAGAFYVIFNAQKSGFSDEYYFNLYIGKNGTSVYGDCYYTRLAPEGMCPMDWQALSREEFEFFLDRTVVPVLEQIMYTSLEELGKEPFIWSGCSCDRKKCEKCWVEKNLWGGI